MVRFSIVVWCWTSNCTVCVLLLPVTVCFESNYSCIVSILFYFQYLLFILNILIVNFLHLEFSLYFLCPCAAVTPEFSLRGINNGLLSYVNSMYVYIQYVCILPDCAPRQWPMICPFPNKK